MSGAARLNDVCSGHSCYGSRPNTEASGDVFTNDRGAHRQGDAWKTHRCSGRSHGGNLASGASDVFINDKQAGRVGDPVSCGSTVMTGSNDVFIGS